MPIEKDKNLFASIYIELVYSFLPEALQLCKYYDEWGIRNLDDCHTLNYREWISEIEHLADNTAAEIMSRIEVSDIGRVKKLEKFLKLAKEQKLI